jgi:hypothetical protein
LYTYLEGRIRGWQSLESLRKFPSKLDIFEYLFRSPANKPNKKSN